MDRIKKLKKKILGIMPTFFPKKQEANQAKSNLLNFIVKTKREKSLKEKIQISPPKSSKKISKIEKKIKKK